MSTFSFIDEKEIHDNGKRSVELLWKKGEIRVIVGKYYAYLNLVSATNKSSYIWSLSKDYFDLNNSKLYDKEITNLKAFTAFWNWMNGAVNLFGGLEYKDYIDMLDYIIYFKCFEDDISSFRSYMEGMIFCYQEYTDLAKVENNKKLYLLSKEKLKKLEKRMSKIIDDGYLESEELFPETPYNNIFKFINRVGKCHEMIVEGKFDRYPSEYCENEIADETNMKCKDHS